MRSRYYILWLDDDFNFEEEFDNDTAVLRDLAKRIKQHLQTKGYIPVIKKVNNKDDALKIINSKEKIDLFLSDYNIGGENDFSGFDFLIATRQFYKQEMLLYSNQDDEQIKKHILEYLNRDDTSLKYFNKFVFQSAINTNVLLQEIKSLIDLTLIRWNELNALRGLYLSETSQIEIDAKNYIISEIPATFLTTNFENNYITNRNNATRKKEVIDYLNGKVGYKKYVEHLDFFEVQCILSDNTNNLYQIWEEIRNIRNGCAHVVQKEKDGENYIESFGKTKMKIKESEIDKYRVKLLTFNEKYYQYYPDSTKTESKKKPTKVQS